LNGKILEGIRIVEFGWAVVGPLTASWAGNYGAQVIKIETRTRPDIIRTMTPFKNDRMDMDNSLFFGRENASKYSMALNLKLPGGIELAKQLVAKSDVVLDSYTAGVMEKSGLGYQELRKRKPDLVMLSSCMYGQTGPLRSMPGYGVPLTAISGLTYLCGWPDRPPCGPYGSYTDYLVPRLNLLAIVSALDYRRRTGKGVWMDAAQIESSVQFVAPALLDYVSNGTIQRPAGNASPRACPHGVYRCRGNDRWCAIAVRTEDEWLRFCKALGNPPWMGEARFATFRERKSNEEALNALVEAWTIQHEAEHVMRMMQESGVPAGILNNGEDLHRDPQLAHDGYYVRLEHPVMGEVGYPRHSIEFSKSVQEVHRSPCLGEHTEFVCKDILGLSDAEFKDYARKGVFQ
jgi:benzylsuccinate CoA-transferase BbsF subunit